MFVNYDPDGLPQATPELILHALEKNLQIIHVICDEPDAKVGDHSGVSFLTMTSFLPRVGDQVKLEDGKYCIVRRVFFAVSKSENHPGLVANVYATLLKDHV